MNPRIKNLWCDALESGEYEQTTEKLKRSGGYCCLGVLSELYAKEHPEAEWKDKGKYFLFEDATGDFSSSALTSAVVNWADLDCGVPAVRWHGHANSLRALSALNDDGVSFKEISALIREQL